MKTEILILALDGLEPEYISSDRFPNLTQCEFGKTIPPITDIDEPSTPIVWVSFVTGMQPDEHGINKSSVYHSKTVNKVMDWIGTKVSNRTLRRIFLRFNAVRKYLKNFESFQTHQPRRESIKVPTIFDLIASSISISVPVLDTDVDVRYRGILEAILGGEERDNYIDFLMKDFEQDVVQLYEALNKYRLVMVHFQLTDLYGHIYCRDIDKILELYSRMDNFVATVKQQIGKECWVLIVSDHGIDKDFGHTDQGFYSSNISLGLNEPKITDFYPIIMSKLEDVKEEEKV